jgi:tRNA (Thr-GGU) A37 N-methylase/DNA-binding XRE family transcriptional regulator
VSQAPKPLNPQLSALDRFGAELRSWRERRGLSQAALARLVHVHPDLIAKVEKAVRRPTRDLVVGCDTQLRAGGALLGLWLSAAAERDRTGAALPAPVPIGSVVRVSAETLCCVRLGPGGGAETLIRLDAGRYTADDLTGLEYFSHIEVVCHQSPATARGGGVDQDTDSDTDGGTGGGGVDRGADRGMEGRSPIGLFARPGLNRANRLAVSRCRLLVVAGLDLHVADLSAEAGTPVLNIEPYTSRSAPRGEVVQPAWAG